MDGNRRYAREMGKEPLEGHRMGKDTLEDVLRWCFDLEIQVLTVYAFSTENFRRSQEEVDTLMTLFRDNFLKVANDDRIFEYNVKVSVLGQRDMLPDEVKEAIEEVEEMTRDHDKYFFNLAVAYGGREELVTAIRSIVTDVKDGRVDPDGIDEKLVSSYLYTAQLPDPDLVFRTSGEVRISNFLLWQLAYSELYFTDVYWPGFTFTEFLKGIRSYQLRKRRYGT